MTSQCKFINFSWSSNQPSYNYWSWW